MAQLIADRRDIDFVLYEQLNAESVTQWETYREFNRKTFDLIISEARSFALKELFPTLSSGDQQGVTFENGVVKAPPSYHRPYKLYLEGEWTSLNEPVELGGQGLPPQIAHAAYEYLIGGNYCCVNYANFGHGTGKMIELFGTEEQKRLFVKNLYTAKWTGGMLLTESDAGSDVGALTTEAVKNEDGTYSITGTKIFITNGDHDMTENIISPVLARIKGAPSGTKGISIFIVPKYWVNSDGSIGDRNDIVCSGVEKKMGCHGSATCTMSMGTKGRCRGMLLGEENKGMQIMFNMMNAERIGVGFHAFTTASFSYQYALDYARKRLQGRDLTAGKGGAVAVPIINHPDIRRMLLWMKAHVNGLRSFFYYTDMLIDKAAFTQDQKEKTYCQGLVDLFIPLLKAYSSQRSFQVNVEAMQILGGYGYIKDYFVEQMVRDCKVTTIYEGTNGIQAMDLLSRKVAKDNGEIFGNFIHEVAQSIANARESTLLVRIADGLDIALKRLGEAAVTLAKGIGTSNVKAAFAHAYPFLEVMGDVIMGWMLLWRAQIAVEKLEKNITPKDKSFYRGQIKTAEFFISTILPGTIGQMNAIIEMEDAAVEMEDAGFGG